MFDLGKIKAMEKEIDDSQKRHQEEIEGIIKFFEKQINSSDFEEKLQEELEENFRYYNSVYLYIHLPSRNKNYFFPEGKSNYFTIDNVANVYVGNLEANEKIYISKKCYDLFVKKLDSLGLKVISKPKFEFDYDSSRIYHIGLETKDCCLDDVKDDVKDDVDIEL